MKMKKSIASITMILTLLMVTVTGVSYASLGHPKQDTVIIELDNNSKIVIVTKSKEDLMALKNYDINQMISDLNEQLPDSVEYLEINDGKAYIHDDEVEIVLKDRKVYDDEMRIKLGSVEVEFNPNEIDDWDDDDWMERKKTTYETDRESRTTYDFNVDIGLNNWLDDGEFPDANNSPYAIKPFGSWYVGLNSMNSTWIAGPVFLEWGVGISWYNWKLEEADFRIEKGPERVEFNRIPNVSGKKSKLTASYINVIMVPMFDFSKGRKKVKSLEYRMFKVKRSSKKSFRFGVGGYVGYRIGSHTKFRFNEGSTREKDKERDNFYLKNFRYGLRGQVGWKDIELFLAYDLNEVFAPDRGPLNEDGESAALNAISFGLTF